MTQARCKNGHLYDSDIYGTVCPYCDRSDNTINFSEESEDILKSVAQEKVMPQDEIKKTSPPSNYVEEQEELKKTISVFPKIAGKDPVVAWLVCVNGNEEGSDYRLTAKTNSIGRGKDNDVCIAGDDTITKDTHAKIDYDILNNNFYLLPGNNMNTIYLNNAPVYAHQLLKAYDVLRFGQTVLCFVPFCSDKFVWSKKKEGDK